MPVAVLARLPDKASGENHNLLSWCKTSFPYPFVLIVQWWWTYLLILIIICFIWRAFVEFSEVLFLLSDSGDWNYMACEEQISSELQMR